MKTLLSLSFIAATAAFFLSPLSLEAVGSIFTAVGLLAVLAADYARPVRSLLPGGSLEALPVAGGGAISLGLAA